MFLPTLEFSSLHLFFFSLAFFFPFSFLLWEISPIFQYFPSGHIFLPRFPEVRGCCHSLLPVTRPQAMLAFLFSKYIPLHNSKPFCNSLDLVFWQNSQALLNYKEVSSEMAIHTQRAHLWKALCTHLGRGLVKGGGKAVYEGLLSWFEYCSVTLKLQASLQRWGPARTQKCRYRCQLEGSGTAEDDLLMDLDKLAPSLTSCWVREPWEQDRNKDIPQDKTDVLQGLSQRPWREAGSRGTAVNQHHLFLLQSTHKSLSLWVTSYVPQGPLQYTFLKHPQAKQIPLWGP